MKHMLLPTFALLIALSADAMEDRHTQETALRQELAQLSSQLDELEKRDDASPDMIQEVRDQVAKTSSAIDSITKHKESLD